MLREQNKRSALGLIERFGAQMLATARRYSANLDDAEDAYQRAAEILLRTRPSGSDEQVLRWLRTTVKHEALAVRARREPVTPAGEVPEPRLAEPDSHERAERYERLQLGVQALSRLKPQEVRCLLLLAQGYSYREIGERTGYSYTKVNRCLTEGRRAFAERLAGIESGAECERLAPQVSALADGVASPADLAVLRPHLRTCLSCRAKLREYRAIPARVAALVPPAALSAHGGGGGLRSLLESVLGAAQDRTATLGDRAHGIAELATGQKVAAVAASTAALAGGGAATVEGLRDSDARPAPAADVRPVSETVPAAEPEPEHAPPPPAPEPVDPAPTPPTPASAPEPPKPRPVEAGTPAPEFAPEVAPTRPPAPAPLPSPAPAPTEFAGGGGGSPDGGGGGEFGP